MPFRTDDYFYYYRALKAAFLEGKYGSREEEVDALLRNDVLVDLYTIVRQGVRVGEPGYSQRDPYLSLCMINKA